MDSQESQGGHHQNQNQHPHHQQQHPHHLHSYGGHPMMMTRPQQQQQHQHHQLQQQQHHQQQQANSYVVPNNVLPTHNNNNSAMMQQLQHQQQQQQQNSGFPFNSAPVAQGQQANLDYSDAASSPRANTSGFNIEPARKKRGRPRKYSPDGNIALGLSPTPVTPISSVVPPADSGSGGGGGGGGGDTEGPSSENPSKKARGRPPGSGKKQLDALGAAGVGFTPHVITVNVGEDIASKIMAFSQQGPRTVCILSANGAICNVTLRQPAMGGGTVTYEGRFEIISLTGSFLRSESNGSSGPSGLSVSLAGADGRVLGGGVAGMLMAATPVQVIVGSFLAEGKKPKSKAPSSTPPPSNMLNFGAPAATGESPPSQGDASSNSSDENGNSPSPFHHEQGPYGNAGQPMHGMSMYANMGWPKSL
ncbi:AT-hook motif nuclear-localized protein 10 [Capsicum baccatum]|uniref:AT-hook motif nuclear-localized protein n=1 Tax=Capsicum baccatum TaxID=33114 RepID=A0A2G2XLL4_CAPBA|nr:AT-hook motif nuclear-localized protein 10 [Capsicum annuum]PHT58251.1 AT-hook motif nuclear-localized protein 10 [Capsicum baccatum]